MASNVSLTVPIWFTLIRIELATCLSIPSCRRSTFVTNKSSPTSWIFFPSSFVSSAQPSQSSSERPSSRNNRIVIHPLRPEAHHIFGTFRRLIRFLEDIFPILIKLARGRIERDGNLLSGLVSGLLNGFKHDFNRFDV